MTSHDMKKISIHPRALRACPRSRAYPGCLPPDGRVAGQVVQLARTPVSRRCRCLSRGIAHRPSPIAPPNHLRRPSVPLSLGFFKPPMARMVSGSEPVRSSLLSPALLPSSLPWHARQLKARPIDPQSNMKVTNLFKSKRKQHRKKKAKREDQN